LTILIWILGAILGLAAVALAAGGVYQALGARADRRRHPPLGRLVSVGSHRLHIFTAGEGAPAVVLDNGLPATSVGWCFVQPRVAEFTATASYDRAGLGWSDSAVAGPRTAGRAAEELHTLLGAAGVPPPYVLVGHSFSGFTARLYAARWPEEVAGIVLVDPIHPSEWLPPSPMQQRQLAAGARMARRVGWIAALGGMRFYFWLIARRAITPRAPGDWIASIAKLPREFLPLLRAFWSQRKPFAALAAGLEGLLESAREVEREAGPLGDVPLVVLSAGNTNRRRLAAHEELARLSSRGTHVVVHTAGHWIHLDEPQVVVAAIREVVEQARKRFAALTAASPWVN
jgi:pimeloyl-ACP methyl ester carboxylesterase